MAEYIVIQNTNPDNFVTEVNKKLRGGWILEGGVSVSIAFGPDPTGPIKLIQHNLYLQALTK